jgi:hypothetical protein
VLTAHGNLHNIEEYFLYYKCFEVQEIDILGYQILQMDEFHLQNGPNFLPINQSRKK